MAFEPEWTRSRVSTVRANSRYVFRSIDARPSHSRGGAVWLAHSLIHTPIHAQFKDVDKGDRIRLTVDKGGARLVEG